MQQYPLPEQDYKVVIYCATYNQRDYIEDALNGFVKQKTDFPFCAVVIDDCSDDNQQEIIKEYARRYPEIIKPILLEYNHYRQGKNKFKYLRPWVERSEYVAQCEGDDYWINENKLQIQVEFMDNHPECSLTYHACKNLYVEGYSGTDIRFGEKVKEEYTFRELLNSYPFQTATVLYTSTMWLSELTTNALSILGCSSVLFFCASLQGRVIGTNLQWSVYRRNNNGISNKIHQGDKSLKLFNGWIEISKHCEKKVSKDIHRIIVAQQLYNLSKTSNALFLNCCKAEMGNQPSVVFSVLFRILRAQISHIVKRTIRK